MAFRMNKILMLLAPTLLLCSCTSSTISDEYDAKMRNITTAELCTVEYTITKVVKADDKATWFKFGDRKILFTAKATMKAGISLNDMNNIKARIDNEQKSIVLTLPEPKILSFNMSPQDTHLEYEVVSLTRFNFDNAERNALLRQAEEDIRADSNIDILKDAKTNATAFFRTLLSQIGFEDIEIRYLRD